VIFCVRSPKPRVSRGRAPSRDAIRGTLGEVVMSRHTQLVSVFDLYGAAAVSICGDRLPLLAIYVFITLASSAIDGVRAADFLAVFEDVDIYSAIVAISVGFRNSHVKIKAIVTDEELFRNSVRS